MNQKYLSKLLQDMTLENFTQSTMDGYFAYIRIVLEFINKDATQVTYADIRTFIFLLKEKQGKLPVVLTREAVNSLIESYGNLKHKAIVSTMYSSGLRVSEVCRLQYLIYSIFSLAFLINL